MGDLTAAIFVPDKNGLAMVGDGERSEGRRKRPCSSLQGRAAGWDGSKGGRRCAAGSTDRFELSRSRSTRFSTIGEQRQAAEMLWAVLLALLADCRTRWRTQ